MFKPESLLGDPSPDTSDATNTTMLNSSVADGTNILRENSMLFQAVIRFLKLILKLLSRALLFISASSKEILDENTVDPDPIQQFARWFDDAQLSQMPLPNAMTLATANKHGKPSARVLLLKEYDHRGFVFYTNYKSRKAQEVEENAAATMVFYWPDLVRQVRIEGTLEKISPEESDRYFRTRPRDSQIGAWASDQSEVVGSRKELDRKFEEIEKRYTGKPVPRPPHWGGYRLKPARIEFWQGRAARMHDRVVYEQTPGGGWTIRRLAP